MTQLSAEFVCVLQNLNVTQSRITSAGLGVHDLGELYTSLLEYGFDDGQVQQALQV